MSVNDIYSHVGVSTDTEGKTTIRFTNTPVARAASFEESGHTGIMFLELPEVADKAHAARFLFENSEGEVAEVAKGYLIRRARPMAMEMGIMHPAKKRGRPAKVKPEERVEQTAALMAEVSELLDEEAA